MDSRTGMIVGIEGDGPPMIGSAIEADAALRENLIAAEDLADPTTRDRLEEMAANRERLVAVSGEVVQKLRLGERELRRRKQRR